MCSNELPQLNSFSSPKAPIAQAIQLDTIGPTCRRVVNCSYCLPTILPPASSHHSGRPTFSIPIICPNGLQSPRASPSKQSANMTSTSGRTKPNLPFHCAPSSMGRLTPAESSSRGFVDSCCFCCIGTSRKWELPFSLSLLPRLDRKSNGRKLKRENGGRELYKFYHSIGRLRAHESIHWLPPLQHHHRAKLAARKATIRRQDYSSKCV